MPRRENLSDFAKQLADIPRPHLISQHSSSLPSTPSQHARRNSFGARSRSPEKSTEDGSPKSAHSETETTSRGWNKVRPLAGCKYETGMAFSRRRIPYSIGGDQLERAKAPPKKFLNPTEEAKLSGDMRELYDRLLPTKESEERRATFIQKLENILNQQWPGNEITVHVFGSSGNKLCTHDSDVDICIKTPMKALEQVCLLANSLAEHGMERVVCVPHAKVPIVKFWDPELQLACDMNVNNTLALENTRMIKTYVDIDDRVRPLAMIIKQWTKRRILNDAALGGTLSSYTWICLILNFLQTRNPPILPSLHKKPYQRSADSNGKTPEFNDDLKQLRGFGHQNTETLGELLFNFFRRYAYDLDYERNVVSVREGRLLSKEGKRWHLMQNNRLCVEEPFNTERNLGNTADDTSFRGIHLELRRAFDLVKDARLAECMEQYNFPSTEEKVWEKPPPKPVPVLTRSRSQSQSSRGNRGGAGHRGGGRHGPGHRAGQPARRASSAAAMNKFAASQVGLQGVRGREFPPREHHLQEQYDQLRLHHHLFNRFQFLQAQEHELRLLQAQAQLQAQVEAAHGLGNGSSVSQQALTDISMNTQIPLTAPLGSGQHFHPFAYPQVPGTPQQIVHTQPSSPAMKPVQPDLRRSLHRSSAADSAYASNPRSHSQPARPLPFSLALQNAPPMPLNSTGYLQYQQQLRQQQQNPYRAMEAGQGGYRPAETLYTQDPRRLSIDPPIEESVPKEYVGYWVNDSPPSRPHRVDSMASRSPAYQDVHPRVRGVPQSVTRLRDTSRSPSPSPTLPFRDRSFSNQSASSAPPGPLQARIDRVPAVMPGPRTSGPVIINGSDGWMMPDYSMTADASSHTTTLSEATSGSDDQFYETPTTAEIETPGQGHNFDDGFSNLEDRKHYFHAQMTVESPFTMSSYNNGYADSTKQRINGPPTEIPPYHNTTRRPNQGNRPAGGLGIQFGEHEVSAKTERRPPPEAGRAPVASSNAESHPEQNNARAEAFLMPIPLLSPVREVRTPSPSATRRREMKEADAPRSNKRLGGKMDLYIPSFADLVRARQEKQTGALEQQPNGFTSSHPAGSARSIESVRTPRTNQQPESSKTQPQVNCWQQPGKKSRKIKTRPNLGQLITGEPLPVDEAERKGG